MVTNYYSHLKLRLYYIKYSQKVKSFASFAVFRQLFAQKCKNNYVNFSCFTASSKHNILCFL